VDLKGDIHAGPRKNGKMGEHFIGDPTSIASNSWIRNGSAAVARWDPTWTCVLDGANPESKIPNCGSPRPATRISVVCWSARRTTSWDPSGPIPIFDVGGWRWQRGVERTQRSAPWCRLFKSSYTRFGYTSLRG
jgi:hypothetical protein